MYSFSNSGYMCFSPLKHICDFSKLKNRLRNGPPVPLCSRLLTFLVEPAGPGYEIPMEAEIRQRPVPRQQRTPWLLTNKHFLDFGGVALGQSKYIGGWHWDSLST